MKEVIGDDPHLSINKENVERLMSKAIIYMAKDSYEILLKYLAENSVGQEIDHSTLFARTLTIYNFNQPSQSKFRDYRINLEMLS